MSKKLRSLALAAMLATVAGVGTTACGVDEIFQRIKCFGEQHSGDGTNPTPSCPNRAGVTAYGVHECWAFLDSQPGLCRD